MGIPLCRYNVEKSDLGCGTKKNVRLEKKWGEAHEYIKKMCYFCPCMKNT